MPEYDSRGGYPQQYAQAASVANRCSLASWLRLVYIFNRVTSLRSSVCDLLTSQRTDGLAPAQRRAAVSSWSRDSSRPSYRFAVGRCRLRTVARMRAECRLRLLPRRRSVCDRAAADVCALIVSFLLGFCC